MKFKFNKTDFVKMGGTALFTAAITTFVVKTTLFKGFTFTSSDRISLTDARTFAAEWDSYFSRLRIHYQDYPGHYTIGTLKAMKFDAHQLDEIINHNRNPTLLPDGTRDSSADEVIICYSKSGSTGGFANLHMIAVGSKGGNLMIDRAQPNNINASSLFDKTRPCPGSPGCPTLF